MGGRDGFEDVVGEEEDPLFGFDSGDIDWWANDQR